MPTAGTGSHPSKIDHKRYLLLFIQDVTRQQQRAALERTFFHDVNNLLSVRVGASGLLAEHDSTELVQTIHKLSLRLVKEVAIQRYLSQNESYAFEPIWQTFTTTQIMEELRSFSANHPLAYDRKVIFRDDDPKILIRTDIFLLLRVLGNMVINALEATSLNGLVKIWLTREDGSVSFHVWNRQEISPEIAARIFQRNFSTKEQSGRGIGTFSMKLLGEKILGCRVSFTTSGMDGTVFTLTCPV